MPKVGIFFFIGDQILIDAVPVEQGDITGMRFSSAAIMSSGESFTLRTLLKGTLSQGLTMLTQGGGSSISQRERNSVYIMMPV